MPFSVSAITPDDPKKVSPFEHRLGSPFRHEWPVVRPGFHADLKTFAAPMVKKAPAKDWLVEVTVPDEGGTEAALLQDLDQLQKATMPRLKLSLPDGFSSECLAHLPPSVEHLSLGIWSSTSFDVKALGGLKNLKSLRLFGPYNGGKAVDLRCLADCERLTHLSLSSPSITFAAPPALEELLLHQVTTFKSPKLSLESLSLLRNSQRADPEKDLNKLLSVVKTTKELILRGDQSKFSALQRLAFPAGLERLTVKITSRKTASAKPLAKLTGLTDLALDGAWSDLKALSSLVNLEQLVLRVHGKNQLDVTGMPKLKVLDTWTDDKDLKLEGWR